MTEPLRYQGSTMATATSIIVPAFDFSEASSLPLNTRFQLSIERAKVLLENNGYQDISDFPCIPQGATEAELDDFENRLNSSTPNVKREATRVWEKRRDFVTPATFPIASFYLVGIALPDEYRRFLKFCRYVKIDDGLEIGGLDHGGVYVTKVPWLSKQHREGVDYLVFANYWQYADGDQLMFDLTEPSRPVIAYLH